MRVREKNILSQGLESTDHHRVAFVSMESLQQQIERYSWSQSSDQ